jgi:hypothetical protein
MICFQEKTTLSFALALTLAACGPAGGDANPDGAVGANGDGGLIDASGPQGDGANVSDASCGAQTAEIPLLELNDPPDLLIVLDKSGSMATPPGFPLPFAPTKWDLMEDAIANITNTYQTNIRFGLTAFPHDADICGVTPGADVNIALSNAGAVNGWMSSNSPTGNTPAHLGLQNASSIYSGIAPNSAGQYVLFATDGLPNCAGSPPVPDNGSNTETLAAVQALASQGIHTFVLGFGDLFGLDPDLLNDAAQAGLEPAPGGPPYFYHADDANSLDAALLAIAGGIIPPTCSFAVTETPPDPDLVTVTLDGNAIPRDASHNNGWDYHPDANTITFFGSACDLIQGGDISVSFVFGCPGPVVD